MYIVQQQFDHLLEAPENLKAVKSREKKTQQPNAN